MLRYLTLPKFCAESGYSRNAVYAKINSGAWREGVIWKKAPDGRIHIKLKGYYEWLEQQDQASALPQKPRSKSTSAIAGSGAASAST